MSAIQEQTKSLKINATNIKSVLVRKNKRLTNLRKIKSRIVDVNLRQAKQAKAASKISGSSGGGISGSPALDIFGAGLKFLSGLFKFMGLMLVGLIINNLPAIISTLKPAVTAVTKGVKVVWGVIRTVGRTMSNFGKWVVSIWNPFKAKENINQIEEGNKEISKESEDLVPKENLGEIDAVEEEGASGGDSVETDAPEPESSKEESKPTTTSTSPPSASKSGELSGKGTEDKVVKDKKPIEETKKTSSPVISGVNEDKAKQIKSYEIQKANLQKKIRREKSPALRKEKIAELKYIENQIKLLKSDISGAKVTTIPKTTNIESLGRAKPNSPTVIVIPMKETKVKTVTVNGGSGGTVLTGSVSSPQPSKIRNSVI